MPHNYHLISPQLTKNDFECLSFWLSRPYRKFPGRVRAFCHFLGHLERFLIMPLLDRNRSLYHDDPEISPDASQNVLKSCKNLQKGCHKFLEKLILFRWKSWNCMLKVAVTSKDHQWPSEEPPPPPGQNGSREAVKNLVKIVPDASLQIVWKPFWQPFCYLTRLQSVCRQKHCHLHFKRLWNQFWHVCKLSGVPEHLVFAKKEDCITKIVFR